MDKGYLEKVFCAACHKPGLICAVTYMLKRDSFHDKTGYHWCPLHTKRGKLLNWALAHDYRAISFVGSSGKRYIIGDTAAKPRDNEEMWKLAVICGQDDAIDAAVQHMANSQFMEEE